MRQRALVCAALLVFGAFPRPLKAAGPQFAACDCQPSWQCDAGTGYCIPQSDIDIQFTRTSALPCSGNVQVTVDFEWIQNFPVGRPYKEVRIYLTRGGSVSSVGSFGDQAPPSNRVGSYEYTLQRAESVQFTATRQTWGADSSGSPQDVNFCREDPRDGPYFLHVVLVGDENKIVGAKRRPIDGSWCDAQSIDELRVDIDDSGNCGGNAGFQNKCCSVPFTPEDGEPGCRYSLDISVAGSVELQDYGYDIVRINNQGVFGSVGSKAGCRMTAKSGNRVIEVNYGDAVTLCYNTVDALFHVGAYAEVTSYTATLIWCSEPPQGASLGAAAVQAKAAEDDSNVVATARDGDPIVLDVQNFAEANRIQPLGAPQKVFSIEGETPMTEGAIDGGKEIEIDLSQTAPAGGGPRASASAVPVLFRQAAPGEWHRVSDQALEDNRIRATVFNYGYYQVFLADGSAQNPAAAGPFALGDVYVFPNPAKHGAGPVLRVQANRPDRISVRIYDVAGDLVMAGAVDLAPKVVNGIETYEMGLDPGRFKSGVYNGVVTAKRADVTLRKRFSFTIVQ